MSLRLCAMLKSSREFKFPTEDTEPSDFKPGGIASEVFQKLRQFKTVVEVDDTVHYGNMIVV